MSGHPVGQDIARNSVRGSLVLTLGNYASGILGAATSFVVARVLGPGQYGVYSLVLVVPGFLQLFLGFGVNNAVVRYSAYALSVGKPEEARRYSLHAAYFIFLTGAAITAFNFAFAGPLAGILLRRADLGPYVALVSISTMGAALLQTATFTSMGWNRMSLSSSLQVTQGTIKFVLSPLLVILGFGVVGAVWGHIASLVGAGIIGTAAVYLTGLRGRGGGGDFAADVRKMLGFGIPLYVGVLISNVAIYYCTTVLAGIATDAEFGLYRAAANLIVPVTLVSASLVYGLFPAFSALDGIGGDVKAAFKQAYKFVAFLLTPMVVFLVSAAPLVVRVFYGAVFTQSGPYLRLLALAYVPIAFGYTVHPAFFNGFGRPKLSLVVYTSGAAALAAAAPLLGVYLGLGINGIILATFLSFFAAWAVGTYLAERYMKARLDVKANGAIVLASAASSLATYMLPTVAHSSVLSLILDMLVFLGLYLSLAPLLGAVEKRDLDVMERSFSGRAAMGRVVRPLISYEKLMLQVRQRRRAEGTGPRDPRA